MDSQSSSSSQPSPPHTGILRDENVALRELFGFKNKASTYKNVPAAGLGARLPMSPMRDVLFVAIDVDTEQGYEEIKEGQSFRIGVSILDTRRLQALTKKPQPAQREFGEIIDAYQYCIGPPCYCQKAANMFSYGQTERILISDVKSRIDDLVSDRQVIFVAHGADNEIKFLKHLGLNSRALYLLDTVKVAQKPLARESRIKLKDMLKGFEIEPGKLHCGGTDAYGALRAMLMLVVEDSEQQKAEKSNHLSRILAESLRKIGLATRQKEEDGKPTMRKKGKKKKKKRRRRSTDTTEPESNGSAKTPSEQDSSVSTLSVASG